MSMAGMGAGKAGLGTYLAMAMIVFGTFLTTHTAYFFAQNQELVGYFRITLQQPGGLHTYIGTIPVEANTLSHHGNIFFLQTGGSTSFAGKGAIQ